MLKHTFQKIMVAVFVAMIGWRVLKQFSGCRKLKWCVPSTNLRHVDRMEQEGQRYSTYVRTYYHASTSGGGVNSRTLMMGDQAPHQCPLEVALCYRISAWRAQFRWRRIMQASRHHYD